MFLPYIPQKHLPQQHQYLLNASDDTPSPGRWLYLCSASQLIAVCTHIPHSPCPYTSPSRHTHQVTKQAGLSTPNIYRYIPISTYKTLPWKS